MGILNGNYAYEQFENGVFMPLIRLLIARKHRDGKTLTFMGLVKEFKGIKGPTELPTFAESINECLDEAVSKGMYEIRRGEFVPKPY